MTVTLRKWHRRIWPIIGLILLLGGVAAFKALPDKMVTNATKFVENTWEFKINTTKKVLEIEVTETLTSPALLLFLSENDSDDIANDQLLGRIDKIGAYQFPLDAKALNMSQPFIKGYNPISKEFIFKTKEN